MRRRTLILRTLLGAVIAAIVAAVVVLAFYVEQERRDDAREHRRLREDITALAESQAQVETLTEQVATLMDANGGPAAEAAELQAQVEALAQQIAVLTDANGAPAASAAELQAQVEALAQQIAVLTDASDVPGAKTAELQAQVEALADQVAALTEEREDALARSAPSDDAEPETPTDEPPAEQPPTQESPAESQGAEAGEGVDGDFAQGRCDESGIAFVEELATRHVSFQVLLEIAGTTPRMALAGPLGEITKARVQLAGTESHVCATEAFDAHAAWVESVAEAFSEFARRASDARVSELLEVADAARQEAVRTLRVLLTENDLPTDVLGDAGEPVLTEPEATPMEEPPAEEPTGAWEFFEGENVSGQYEGYILTGEPGGDSRYAVLFLRCIGADLDAYIGTGELMFNDNTTDRIAVQYRMTGTAQQSARWWSSEDSNSALFAQAPENFVAWLGRNYSDGDTLYFSASDRFDTYTADFALTGLPTVLEELPCVSTDG